jgi:predicted transcriptional regulator
MTRKEAILRALQQLPENTTIEDAQYQLYVLQKIQEGEDDVEAGRTVAHEDVMRELAQWLE